MFKNFFKQVSKTAGFTMVELLIVITVIGILAVAVLSAINPVEQVNKGRDTRTRSDATEMINGIERYFAIQETYPWNVATANYTPADTAFDTAFTFDGITTGADWDWLDQLTASDEVKPGYVTRMKNDSKFIIFKPVGANENVYVCYQPTSTAFQFEAARDCANGLTPGGANAPISAPTGVTTCATTDGTVDDQNFICLG